VQLGHRCERDWHAVLIRLLCKGHDFWSEEHGVRWIILSLLLLYSFSSLIAVGVVCILSPLRDWIIVDLDIFASH